MRTDYKYRSRILWDDHWTNGGTGITRFSPKNLERYKKAIAQSGRSDLFLNGNELHCNQRTDLSAFWKIYDSLI